MEPGQKAGLHRLPNFPNRGLEGAFSTLKVTVGDVEPPDHAKQRVVPCAYIIPVDTISDGLHPAQKVLHLRLANNISGLIGSGVLGFMASVSRAV